MNIARNSFVVFSATISTGVFVFLTQIFLARKMGAEGLGIYGLFVNILTVAVLIGNMGIGTASLYLVNKSRGELEKLVSNLIVFGLLWGIAIGVLAGLIFLAAPFLFKGLEIEYLILALLIVPPMLTYTYLLSFFWSTYRVRTWMVLSVMHTFLMLTGIFIAVRIFNQGIQGVITALVVSVLVPFFIILALALKNLSTRLVPDQRVFKEQIKFGLGAYFSDIFHVINFKTNFFIINALLGITSVGYYSVSYSLAALVFIVPFSLQQAVSPVWSSFQEEQIDKETPKAARQALLLGLIVAAVTAVLGPLLIELFYGPSFTSSILPFLLMLPAGVFATFASIFFNNFFAKGKPYITSLILLLALGLNIFLSIIFIPLFGIAGSSLAASISYFVLSVLAVFIFHRMTRVSFTETLSLTKDDLYSLLNNAKKIISLFYTKSFDVQGKKLADVKNYYEEKTTRADPVIKTTFESEIPYKRIFFKTRFSKIMEMLEVKPNENFLDIGCGEGYYTKAVSKLTPHVVATEIVDNVISLARSYVHNPAVKYVCCPAEKLALPDNVFDKVLMADVLEQLFDADKGIQEAWRVLKRGGTFIVATRNRNSYLNLLFRLKKLILHRRFTGDTVKEFSSGELRQLLKKNGFLLERKAFSNYFPYIFPKFCASLLGFERLERFAIFIDLILEKIPGIRRQAFILIFKAHKE